MKNFYEYIKTMQPSYADLNEVVELHRGSTFAELKYDGYRLQIHKGEQIRIYTRNANELNYECYPDIMEIVSKLPSCIIDAELVGTGSSHKEVFDNVKQRFRREGISQKAVDNYLGSGVVANVPLHLRVFETLNFEGRWLDKLPLEERRKYTEKLGSEGILPSESVRIYSTKDLENLLEDTFKKRQEGRVCKKPGSVYIPGGDGIEWVKFKRYEPLDLVVVGFYTENFRMNIPFGSVLCATYNEATGMYETIGKVGVTRNGFADQINNEVKGKLSKGIPGNVVLSEKISKDKHMPDFFINPDDSVVIEVRAMNLNFSENWHTCGMKNGKAYSMRIGFMQQLRNDKSPKQSTKTSAVQKLYELQVKNEH